MTVNAEPRRHGDDTEKTERATGPHSGPLTTKGPAKMQALDRDGLYFRRLFRRQ